MKPKKFAYETELCEDFLSQIPREWAVYPEQYGFDIFLVRNDGTQLGLQAKLRFTTELLDQALPHRSWEKSPDFMGVLVPSDSPYNGSLCEKIKLILLTENYGTNLGRTVLRDEHRWHTDSTKRLKVPEYAANLKAGSPCPAFLSPWKISAIRFSWSVRGRSEIKAKEFRAAGQDPQLWEQKGWAKRIGRGLYSVGDKPLPHVCYAHEGKQVIESLQAERIAS